MEQQTAGEFQRAMALHQQGRLDEARAAYEQVLLRQPRSAEAMNLLGVIALQENDPRTAVERFGHAIALNPELAIAHINRGTAYSMLDQHESAIGCYDRAIELDPDSNASPYYNRGNSLQQMKRYEAALASYDQAIELDSDLDANAYYGRATALLALNDRAAAVESFEKAIQLGTNYAAEAYCSRGLALAGLHEYDASLTNFQKSIDLGLQSAAAYKGRGFVLSALARYEEAAQSFDTAIDLAPGDAESYNNRGLALAALKRLEAALASFDEAIRIEARFADAWFNRGNVLAEMKRLDEAIGSFDRAIGLKPGFSAAYANRAQALVEAGRLEEALACAARATAVEPASADAWFVRGQALKELGSYEQALEACNKAISLHRDYTAGIYARANLLLSMGDRRGAVEGFREVLRIDPSFAAARMAAAMAEIPALPSTAGEAAASRDSFALALTGLAAHLESNPPANASVLVGALQPFYLAYQAEDNRDLLVSHGRLCANLMALWRRSAAPARMASPKRTRSKVRVGFVSAQIADHSVYNAITRGWMQRLDRDRIGLEVFHLSSRTDAQTAAARTLTEHFEQGPHTIRDWVAAIMERQLDILIYPELGMDQTTLQLASMRLAPVQLVTWGHPATSGLPTLDYFVSADAFEPADAESHYSERLVRLPGLGVYYDPPGSSDEPTRRVAADRETGPVLVCAGTPYKYAPAHDSLLVQIARRLGRCQFHFFQYLDGALSRRLMHRLHDAFSASGLDGEQYLFLRPWASPHEFHDVLRAADLMLDTVDFSGFNTVMQALECRLPVVTCRGRFMRGRFGSGILDLLSLSDLVASNPRSYVDKVVSLAEDAAARRGIEERLRAHLPRARRDRSATDGLQELLLGLARGTAIKID